MKLLDRLAPRHEEDPDTRGFWRRLFDADESRAQDPWVWYIHSSGGRHWELGRAFLAGNWGLGPSAEYNRYHSGSRSLGLILQLGPFQVWLHGEWSK